MTTDKQRRRQFFVGLFLVLLAVGTIVTDMGRRAEDTAQRACFEDKFRELSVALDARADLAEQESALDKRETDALAKIFDIYIEASRQLEDDPTGELEPNAQKRLQKELVEAFISYDDVVKEINAERARIKRERKENPLPPYPVGVCD